MSAVLKLYKTLLSRYPRTVQSAQAGILVGAGDVISQTVVERRSITDLNYKRTLQYFAVGAFYVGPAVTTWYYFLDRRFGHGGKQIAFKKMVLDQLCFAPVCLFGFLFCVNAAQGKSFENNRQSIIENYPDVLLANYKLWPAVQLVNFYWVPLQFQVLLVQFVALGWNIYLCFKTKPQESV